MPRDHSTTPWKHMPRQEVRQPLWTRRLRTVISAAMFALLTYAVAFHWAPKAWGQFWADVALYRHMSVGAE